MNSRKRFFFIRIKFATYSHILAHIRIHIHIRIRIHIRLHFALLVKRISYFILLHLHSTSLRCLSLSLSLPRLLTLFYSALLIVLALLKRRYDKILSSFLVLLSPVACVLHFLRLHYTCVHLSTCMPVCVGLCACMLEYLPMAMCASIRARVCVFMFVCVHINTLLLLLMFHTNPHPR